MFLEEYNVLNEDRQDKWETDNPRWRQRVRFASFLPAHINYNTFDGQDEHVYVHVIDQTDRFGTGFVTFSVTATNTSNFTPGGPFLQTTRDIWTWERVQKFPL